MKQTVSFFKYIRRFLRFTSDLALTRKPSQNNTHTHSLLDKRVVLLPISRG